MGKSPVTTKIELDGSNEPTFIINCGDDYFVTQSVASYILAEAKTAEQRADVESVKALFDAAKSSGKTCVAVKLSKANNVMSYQQTSRF